MALDILRPLLNEVESKLSLVEKEQAMDRFVSLYGDSYKNRKDLIAVMELLVLENKINPANTLIVEEGMHGNLNSYVDIKRSVEAFKEKNKREILDFEKKAPKQFVGRDMEWLATKLVKNHGVIIWGTSGVGKTRLAKQFMDTWTGRTKTIDLRGIDDIDLVFIEILKSIGRPTSINDVSLQYVLSEFEKYTQVYKNILMLLDNADDFIKYPNYGIDHTIHFAELVTKILKVAKQHVKLLITSRERSKQTEVEESFNQEELLSLKKEDASSVIKANLLHESENEIVINNAVECCKSLPLNLTILGAALQDQGVTLTQLIPVIKREAAKWHAKKKEKANEKDISTYSILDTRFQRLSDTIQQSAVVLSLFTRSFSFKTVEQVFKSWGKQKITLILDHLKHVNLITIEFDNKLNKHENIYDMHPKVKEFLMEKRDLQHIKEFYLESKHNFMSYFTEYMVNVSKLIDTDYLKGYEMYQEECSNLEFMLHDHQPSLVLFDGYEDIQQIGILLRCMLKDTDRLAFFQNVANNLMLQGHKLLGAQYLCQVALAESFFNPIKALEYNVLHVKHILFRELQKSHWKPNRLLHEVEALYHYTKGEQLYSIAHSNHREEDCKESIEEFALSVEIREKIYQHGHSDLVRSYISKGNGHNMMKDICEKETASWRQHVDLALECYEKALKMRIELSNSELHFDSPQIFENIGTIQVQKKMYSEAEMSFLKAIALEKQMKLDGLYNTSTKFVNIGALCQTLERYEEAYEYYYKAYEIRKALKGDHKDTVLTIYRMAVVKHSSRKFEEAIAYYKEAFLIDESLPANYHSAVRKDIRRYMVIAMKSLRKYEKDPSKKEILQSQIETWQERFHRMDAEESEMLVQQSPSTSFQAVEKMDVYTTKELLPEDSCKLHDERSVQDFVDKTGGFVEFDYLGVYLTLPRCLTDRTLLIGISRLAPAKVDMMLRQCEYLVSDIILVKASDFLETELKSPALLEIPCIIADSNLHEYSNVSIIEYNVKKSCWTEVEHFQVFSEEKYGSYKSKESIKVVHAWIRSFTMFALILKPNPIEFVIGSSGRICRPIESESIEAAFEPGTFGNNEHTCIMKIMMPKQETIRYCQEEGCIVSPVLGINISANQLERPANIKLPLLGTTDHGGNIVIFKQDDDPRSTWIDVTEIVQPILDMENHVISFQVTNFSFFVAVWTTTRDIALWAASLVCSLPYDVIFHLYKGIGIDRLSDFPIALSCIPITGNEEEQEHLCRMPERGGKYVYIDSQPALEKMYDSEKVLVDVSGQFQLIEQDNVKKLLKFNKDVSTPTKFRVIKDLNAGTKGGTVTVTRQHRDELLCNFPFFDNFVFTEAQLMVEQERKWKLPFRFLGLLLENGGLENANLTTSDFMNRLYQTGLDQDIIDGLNFQHRSRAETEKAITKKILKHITDHFKRNKLSDRWFDVFRKHIWPKHTRKNLCKVMTFLETELTNKKRLILHDSIGKVISQSVLANLTIRCCGNREDLKNVSRAQNIPNRETNTLLTLFLSKYKNALDMIRELLWLEDDFPRDIEMILDTLGICIENQLQLAY